MEVALDQAALNAVFEVPNNDGTFGTALRAYLQGLGSKRPAIILAFPPKAAGTFLCAAAIKATGGDLVRIVHAQGGRDAQPYLPTLLAYYLGGICPGPLVTHVHMQALPANIALLEAFDLRPAIMLRSLPDMLLSYGDMLQADGAARLQGLNCAIPAGYIELAPDRRIDFLIDILGPWYASYFATWLDYARRADGRVRVLTYSQFVENPAATLEAVLLHAGIVRTRTECQAAIEATWRERHKLRFNRGVEGRGAECFTQHQLERIAKLLTYYPAADGRRADLIGL
jgi:hypothetical protein